MIVYFSFYSIFILTAILNLNISTNSKFTLHLFISLLLILFIGLRHEVGGDWYVYIENFEKFLPQFNFYNFNYYHDFGFDLVSKISDYFGWGIIGVNLFCAIFFIIAMFNLAQKLGNISIFYIVAFPYLITVVSMGYTRQAAALAFAIFAYLSVINKKLFWFLIFSTIGIFFLLFLALFILIIAISYLKWSLKNIIIVILISSVSYLVIIEDISRIQAYFMENLNYQSNGVIFRIIINLFSCFFLLLFSSTLCDNKEEKFFLFSLFLATVISLFYYQEISTFIDRILIYFTFIQLIIMTRLERLSVRYSYIINLVIILFYSLYYALWFIFAFLSFAWLPYSNILLL